MKGVDTYGKITAEERPAAVDGDHAVGGLVNHNGLFWSEKRGGI